MKKWNDLAKQMKIEENILNERNSAKTLSDLCQKGLATLIEKQGKIIAFGGLWPDDFDCLELGSMWVHPNYRNQGLASKVFSQLATITKKQKKKIFCITHNPRIIHLLAKTNWNKANIDNWEDYIPLESSCGPCEDVPKNEQANCSFKANSRRCMMFYC